MSGQVVGPEVGLDLESLPHITSPSSSRTRTLPNRSRAHDNRVSFENEGVEDGVALSRWEF